MKIKTSTLTVLVGMPGSGKTTYAESHFPVQSIISMDECWERSCSAPMGDSMFWALIETCLQRRRSIVIDRTCLNPATRHRLLARGNAYDYAVHAILLDPPFATAVARDGQRETPFPLATLQRCYEKVAETRGVLLNEGFDRVTILTGS